MAAPDFAPAVTLIPTRKLSLTNASVAEFASISLIAPLPSPDTEVAVPPLAVVWPLSAAEIAACSAPWAKAPGKGWAKTTPPPPPIPLVSEYTQVVAVQAPPSAVTFGSPLMLCTLATVNSVFAAGADPLEPEPSPGIPGMVKPPPVGDGVGVEMLADPPQPAIPRNAPIDTAAT